MPPYTPQRKTKTAASPSSSSRLPASPLNQLFKNHPHLASQNLAPINHSKITKSKMLKGISALISPDLLATLHRMGHGEEIVFADAHFPVHEMARTNGATVLRADGLNIPDLLEAILPLLELDAYADHSALMMDVVPGDTADPEVEQAYRSRIDAAQPGTPAIAKLERFAFYERTKSAHAIVATGDTAKYANLILKKGVTPC